MKVSVKDLRAQGQRTSPWMVIYYRDRRPVRTFYGTREEAEQKAADLRKIYRLGGNPDDVAQAFRLAGGTGYSLAQLVQLGLQAIKSSGAVAVSPEMTFAEATARVIARASAQDRRSATINGYKKSFRDLNRTLGNRSITGITEHDVQTLLDSKKGKQGGGIKPWSRITTIRLIKTAMRAAGMTNPLPTLIVPKVGTKPVQFFSVEQVQELLRAANPRERGGLALLLFAALRPTLIERLPTSCIDLHARKITIPDYVAKDRLGHILEAEFRREDGAVIPGLPNILWKWLEAFPFERVPWAPFQKRLRKALGHSWIHDGTRHTGATYYAALNGREATKSLLTHESPMMAVRHYIGQATRADAAEYFKLNPADFQGHFPAPWKAKVVKWPPDDKLAAWVQREPSTAIAKKLGCSDTALAKRCRRRGIAKPKPGEWQTRKFRSGEADKEAVSVS